VPIPGRFCLALIPPRFPNCAPSNFAPLLSMTWPPMPSVWVSETQQFGPPRPWPSQPQAAPGCAAQSRAWCSGHICQHGRVLVLHKRIHKHLLRQERSRNSPVIDRRLLPHRHQRRRAMGLEVGQEGIQHLRGQGVPGTERATAARVAGQEMTAGVAEWMRWIAHADFPDNFRLFGEYCGVPRLLF
jgi:hypothetical protein